MKRKAIGYVRVSTTKQAQDGVSIDAQIERINLWASYHDYEIAHIFIDEGISGKSMLKRKELQNALAMLEKGMVFVFYSLSRVSRNTIDALTIAERINAAGADMVSLSENIDTTGATGRMIFSILAVFSQFERDQVSERTKMALDYLRTNNKVYSSTPYGFDQDEDNLIPNEYEQGIIKYMIDLQQQGYGYRKIATRLNKEEIKSKLGGIWYAKTVKQILERNMHEYSEIQKAATV